MSTARKTVLVTGAKRLGRAVCVLLAGQGWDVVFTYHSSQDEAAALSQSLTRRGATATAIQADLSTPSGAGEVITRTLAAGGVDAFVHCASRFDRHGLGGVNPADMVGWYFIEAGSPLLICQGLAHVLAERRGSVVLTTDAMLDRGVRGYPMYAAAKGAAAALVPTLAHEMAPHVRVNGVAPGAMLPLPGQTSVPESWTKRIPLKRVGGARSYAQAVCTLLLSSYLNGVILKVDGGRSIG